MRRHRVARWLLVPFVYLGVAVAGIFVGATFGWYGEIGSSRAQYAVKLEDWKNHPGVKAVREIYDEVKTGINDKKYKSRIRRFDIESASCATYPIKSQTLVSDIADRVRLYKIEQIGSHRESFTVERYYDSNGKLRFVFVQRLFSNVRIYLNNAGNVFWAVEQSNNMFTVFDSSNEDWEMRPNNEKEAREEFQAQQLCSEITK